MDKDDLDTIRHIIEYIFRNHKEIEKNVYSIHRISKDRSISCDYYEVIVTKYSYLIDSSTKDILKYYDRDNINLVVSSIIEEKYNS